MTQRDKIGALAALAGLPGWRAAPDADALARTYRFEDFPTAMAFMAEVAKVAQAMDHHPDWRNIYDRVEVLLSTHTADGVTEMDVRLAKAMDKAAAALGVSSA